MRVETRPRCFGSSFQNATLRYMTIYAPCGPAMVEEEVNVFGANATRLPTPWALTVQALTGVKLSKMETPSFSVIAKHFASY